VCSFGFLQNAEEQLQVQEELELDIIANQPKAALAASSSEKISAAKHRDAEVLAKEHNTAGIPGSFANSTVCHSLLFGCLN